MDRIEARLFNNSKDVHQLLLDSLNESFFDLRTVRENIFRIINNNFENVLNYILKYDETVREYNLFRHFDKEDNINTKITKYSLLAIKKLENLKMFINEVENACIENLPSELCMIPEYDYFDKEYNVEEDNDLDLNAIHDPIVSYGCNPFAVKENVQQVISRLIQNEKFAAKEVEIVIPRRLPRLVINMKRDLENGEYMHVLTNDRNKEIFEKTLIKSEWKKISTKLRAFIKMKKIDKKLHSGGIDYAKLLLEKYAIIQGFDYAGAKGNYRDSGIREQKFREPCAFKVKIRPDSDSLDKYIKKGHKLFFELFFEECFCIKKGKTLYYYGLLKNNKPLLSYFYKVKADSDKERINLFVIKQYYHIEDMIEEYDADQIYEECFEEGFIEEYEKRVEWMRMVRAELAKLIFLQTRQIFLEKKGKGDNNNDEI